MTLQQEISRQAEMERIKNEEFEENNPEFCTNFVEDMKSRDAANKKKQDSADISRLKGNRYFKKKDFNNALEHYMEALKVMPYDVKTLTNIAQVLDISWFLQLLLLGLFIIFSLRRIRCS